MLLRGILLLCFSLVLNGCVGAGGVFIGLAGPVTCAEKVSEDKDAGVLDYLKVPAAILFGPIIGISREMEVARSGQKPADRIKYIADVCDKRSMEEYFKALHEQKRKDDIKKLEEKK